MKSNPAAGNQQSLHVSYLHLSQAYLDLAVLVPDCPQALLQLFHKTARDAVLCDFPEFAGIHEEVFVRITELPVEDSLRELRYARLSVPEDSANYLMERGNKVLRAAQHNPLFLNCTEMSCA